MRGGDFQDFFERASQLVEDALEDDRDIFMDYSGADKEDEYVLLAHYFVPMRTYVVSGSSLGGVVGTANPIAGNGTHSKLS